MFEIILPPAFFLIFGAILVAIVRPALRPVVALLAPLVTLYAIWQVEDGVRLAVSFLGYEVQLVEGGPLRRLFATIFALMAFGGVIFSLRDAKWWELSAALAYAAGAVGVSFAGDLIVMFVFWEFMALFSTVVIWSGGTEAARRAGIRYVIMHLVGGIVLRDRHRGPDDPYRLGRDSSAQSRELRYLDDLDRAARECRCSADLGLAARCLPRINADRWGLAFRLHHQDRGARAHPSLPGHGTFDLCRPVDDLLRDHLRAARERHAPNPVVLDRQPGGLHGLRGGDRHRDGAQWRGGACLHPHSLQGAFVHERRRGARGHRQAQVLRSRWSVSHHAAHHPLRGDRRLVDLGLSADLRLRFQIAHRSGGGR